MSDLNYFLENGISICNKQFENVTDNHNRVVIFSKICYGHKIIMYAKIASIMIFYLIFALSEHAYASGRIPFSPWDGAEVTVTGVSNLDTNNAIIYVRHLPINAQEFCNKHMNNFSKECVKDRLSGVKLNDKLVGDCESGKFVNLEGTAMHFKGFRKHRVANETRYVITGPRGELDGSSASRYSIMLAQFQALCPRRVTVH